MKVGDYLYVSIYGRCYFMYLRAKIHPDDYYIVLSPYRYKETTPGCSYNRKYVKILAYSSCLL